MQPLVRLPCSSMSKGVKGGGKFNAMLVPVRTSVDLRRCNEQNNELYQLKVDVGMLNTVKIY